MGDFAQRAGRYKEVMMRWIALVLTMISIASAQSFPPDSVWTFAYDHDGDEYFYDAVSIEGGYFLCGEAREWNALAGDALLVRIDDLGRLVWARTYSEESFRRFRHFHYGFSSEIVELRIIGETLSPSGVSQSVFEEVIDGSDGSTIYVSNLCELSPELGTAYTAAKVEWSIQEHESWPEIITWHFAGGDSAAHMRYDTGCNSLSIGKDIIITDASEYNFQNFYYCGYTRHLTDSLATQGVLIETAGATPQLFGGAENDRFRAVLKRQDQRLWGFGWSESYTNGAKDSWAVGYSTLPGVDPISRHYGGLSNEDAVEAFLGSDNGYIIAGNFSSEDVEFEQSDFWLLKVDENGDSVWSVVKGRDEADRCEGMIKTENGFLLFGASQSYAVPGWDGCAMLLAYVPDIAAVPSAVNFGPVNLGSSTTRSMSLINTGSNVLNVDLIAGSANYSAWFVGPRAVAIGDTLQVDIDFTPQSAGVHIDTLVIYSDAVSGLKFVRCLGAGMATDAVDETLLPTEFSLHPPYPNPFNPAATVTFDLPNNADVTLEIFDVQGRVVETLFEGELSAGTHSRVWSCGTCAGGVYFARLRASEFVGIQKLVLMK